ncbi:MAG: (d)CMP kinase [Burkholderiaceae bacterium]|jgi:cytidylate kinase|nr:(d)CMP kinase [Burkholderiaceae bacterium]
MTPPDTPFPFVIAIDGPTASGKGTVARILAEKLGFHYLDSGALYRLVALMSLRTRTALDDEQAVGHLASVLPCRFEEARVFLSGEEVSDDIRTEEVGNAASRIAELRQVRHALIERQRAFRQAPGLVADGRDMGTIIFPDAPLKVFLTASVDIRTERRYNQLIEKGFSANMSVLRRDLSERDERDAARPVAPLVPARDALVLDTTRLHVAETVDRIMSWYIASKK